MALECFKSPYQIWLSDKDFNLRAGAEPFNHFKECSGHSFPLQNLNIKYKSNSFHKQHRFEGRFRAQEQRWEQGAASLAICSCPVVPFPSSGPGSSSQSRQILSWFYPEVGGEGGKGKYPYGKHWFMTWFCKKDPGGGWKTPLGRGGILYFPKSGGIYFFLPIFYFFITVLPCFL